MKAKKTAFSFALLWLAAAFLSLPVYADENQGEVLRQIDIMAQVLENRLNNELPGEVVRSSIFEPGGVWGFWAPGIGAVFQIKVEFPVAEPKRSEQSDVKETDDLWDRIEQGNSRQIYGEKSTNSSERKNYEELSSEDRQKVERLKDVIADTLARYAERMTALGPGENIVVLVSGSGGDRSRQDVFVKVKSIGNGAAGSAMKPSVQINSRSRGGISQASSWVLRIKKGNCAKAPGKLLEKAEIHAYAHSSY